MPTESQRASCRGAERLAAVCAILVSVIFAGAAAGPSAQQGPAAPAAGDVSPAPATVPATPSGGRKVTGRIRGTIYGGAKKPLAGLLVVLSSREQAGLLRVTNTDEVGQYLFSDLPAGAYAVEVAPDAYVKQKKNGIDVHPPFQNMVDFQLTPGRPSRDGTPGPPGASRPTPGAQAPPGDPVPDAGVPVRGTLLDQRKKPVVEVSVTLVSEADKRIYQTLSNEDGSFSITAVPPGRYRVLVASPGHVGLDLKSIEIDPKDGLNLSLSLVDYPLNFLGDRDNLLPREQPRPSPAPAPAPTPTPAPSPVPAGSPAPAPGRM